MPKRILIIGILFCLGGILAFWDVASDLFRSNLNINFAIFMLPVGIGILKGKRSSQWWGRFWIILGYIGCVLLVTASVVWPQNVTASFFGSEIIGTKAVPYVLIGTVLFAISLVVIHRSLYSSVAQVYFTHKCEQDGAGNRYRAPR